MHCCFIYAGGMRNKVGVFHPWVILGCSWRSEDSFMQSPGYRHTYKETFKLIQYTGTVVQYGTFGMHGNATPRFKQK